MSCGSLGRSLCQHGEKHWHKRRLYHIALAARLPARGPSPGGQLNQRPATPAQYKVTETSTQTLARESSKWKKADEKKNQKHTKARETRQRRRIRKKRAE